MGAKIKLIIALTGVVGILLSHGFVYFKGRSDMEGILAGKDLSNVVRAIKTKEEINEKVYKMESPAIDRALIAHNWMRHADDL